MSDFPDTPVALLARIASERTGESEADWMRFFNLYQPVIVGFARSVGAGDESEDVAQEIFVRLVDVLRAGKYRPERGRFRSYLSVMVRREVINRWYKDRVRAKDRMISLDDKNQHLSLVQPSLTETVLDVKWRLACAEAARKHVLTKTALSEQSKAIYRAYVLEERPIDEVAAEFGLSRNAVLQVKSRIERMVAKYESMYGA